MTICLKRLVFISILVTFSNFPVTAQALGGAGTITGTITDPTGLVIAGATVTLTNPATGFKRTAQSDVSGTFRFTGVPPQSYHVEVTSPGLRIVVAGCDRKIGGSHHAEDSARARRQCNDGHR